MESDIKRILVRLPEQDVISLDAAADDLGISRNALIAMVLHQYVDIAADRDGDTVPLPDPAVIKDVNVVNINVGGPPDPEGTPEGEKEDILGMEGEPFGPPPPVEHHLTGLPSGRSVTEQTENLVGPATEAVRRPSDPGPPTEKQHWHRFKQGDKAYAEKGWWKHRWTCECGATKIE